jgi:PAS domain S-box-containing protein
MIFDMASERIRRRQVQCFWAGIVTAIAVAAYRIYVTVSGMAQDGATLRVSLDTWTTNGFILWSLTLFVLAWFFWRDARRRQDELATVVRSILPDVLLVTDAAGKVWMCNPAAQAMFGYEPEELLGRETDKLLQDRPAVGTEHEMYDRLQRTGYAVRPGTGIRKDGAKFPVEITTAKLLEQSGAVSLVRDVTERVRVEQLRENLTHMLVHDLRNPLFGISGNLHLVVTSSPNLSEDAQTSVRVALDFVRDMSEMLRCLVDVNQLEAGGWPLRPTESDVSQLVDKAWAPLAALAHEKRHTVVWSRASAMVRCDPELIERVVLNLLRNAVEATPSGGRIEIRVERMAERLRFSVSDNGPGVPREFQTLIFEKFGQTPDGRKVKRRSSGLGLIFCKLAVEAHGGSIGVESPSIELPPSPVGFRLREEAAPGQAGEASRAGDTDQGSTFWFELPVTRAI